MYLFFPFNFTLALIIKKRNVDLIHYHAQLTQGRSEANMLHFCLCSCSYRGVIIYEATAHQMVYTK